jgi:uncharacterized membrane protein
MSLVPFVTEFLGKNYRQPMAVALYGLDLAFCGASFTLLRTELIRQDRDHGKLPGYHVAVRRKNAFTVALYCSSVLLAYVSIYCSFFIFALVPALYFLPEKGPAESAHE